MKLIKNGVLHKILNELFKEVRESSKNYKDAQVCLDLLAKELDPVMLGLSLEK